MGGRRYSQGFIDRMVERLTGPGAVSAVTLSEEVNIHNATLSRWVRQARSLGDMGKKKRPQPQLARQPVTPVELTVPAETPDRDARSLRDWTPAEKLRVIAAASQCSDERLGELLRREGLHLAQLEEWREEVLRALGTPPSRRRDPNAQRIRELEREVNRKDKALAEVTALLVLRKKADALFGNSAEEGDSTNEEPESK